VWLLLLLLLLLRMLLLLLLLLPLQQQQQQPHPPAPPGCEDLKLQQQRQQQQSSSSSSSSQQQQQTHPPAPPATPATNAERLRAPKPAAAGASHSSNSTVKQKSTPKQHKATKREPRSTNKGFVVPDAVNFHPRKSPREGTGIATDAQRAAVLRCPNQSKCIVPALQLAVKLRVYYCKHPVRQGVRFWNLIREGLLMHPNVELVDEVDAPAADFVVYLPGSAPWHRTECANVSLAGKMIVLDEFDFHNLYYPRPSDEEVIQTYGSLQWYFMYYKRSFVRRKHGRFLGYPHFKLPDVYPMTYALAEAYTQHQFNFQREIDILCTLRGSKQMTTRQRVQEWVAEYGQARNVTNTISKQVNRADRTGVSKEYFEQMYNAQIIVTVNPANWEGDFRLWESFATGALVFADPLFVPHPNPLVHGEHVVYFDNDNKTDLFAKLDYYRANKDEARRIAVNGYLHAMKYHRTVNLIDYVMRSAHYQRAKRNGETPLPQYQYTAQYLNDLTRKHHKAAVKDHKPANWRHQEAS